MRTRLASAPQPGVKNRVNRLWIAADDPVSVGSAGGTRKRPGAPPQGGRTGVRAFLALLRYGIHVGIGCVPRDHQLKELGRRVEPPLLSSRQPLHNPGDPPGAFFPAGEPNHEIVQSFGDPEGLVWF